MKCYMKQKSRAFLFHIQHRFSTETIRKWTQPQIHWLPTKPHPWKTLFLGPCTALEITILKLLGNTAETEIRTESYNDELKKWRFDGVGFSRMVLPSQWGTCSKAWPSQHRYEPCSCCKDHTCCTRKGETSERNSRFRRTEREIWLNYLLEYLEPFQVFGILLIHQMLVFSWLVQGCDWKYNSIRICFIVAPRRFT